MPFMQSITVMQTHSVKIPIVNLTGILRVHQNTYLKGNNLYDNALRGNHFYSTICIIIMPFMQVITGLNYYNANLYCHNNKDANK